MEKIKVFFFFFPFVFAKTTLFPLLNLAGTFFFFCLFSFSFYMFADSSCLFCYLFDTLN